MARKKKTSSKGSGRTPYRIYDGLLDTEQLDFLYRQLKRSNLPESTQKMFTRELSYRKAFEPIYETKFNKMHDMDLNTAACPRCKRGLKTGATGARYTKSGLGTRFEFCPRCGQHIDWSKFVITDPYSDEAIRARLLRRREERLRLEREQQAAAANAGIREETDVAGLESADDSERPADATGHGGRLD